MESQDQPLRSQEAQEAQPLEPQKDPTEEIWVHEDDPELEQPDENSNYQLNEQRLNLFRKPKRIAKYSKYFKNPQPMPEFEATICGYPSETNLALYDHDRESFQIASYRFYQTCFVYRHKNPISTVFANAAFLIYFVNEEDAKMGILPHQNAQILFQLKLENSGLQKGKSIIFLDILEFFRIIPQPLSELDEIMDISKRQDKRVYKNIRQKENQPDQFTFHQLQKDDEIRFGLENFRVIEIELNPSSQRKQKSLTEKVRQQNYCQLMYKQQIGQKTCKICLSTGDTEKDTLLNPCDCKGTCQYVHLSCLKTWLDSNLEKETQDLVDSYNWTKMECEICKVTYPFKIKYEGRIVRLADYAIPQEPYIVFERLRKGCRKQIIVVKGTEFPVHVGRNPDCQFKIFNNTVSRVHAVIEFRDGQFYLKDMASKYGTLVRINRPMRVQGKLKIQVGDMLIRFDLVVMKQGRQYVWKYN